MNKMSIEEHYIPLPPNKRSLVSYNKQIYYDFDEDDELLEVIGWRSYRNIRSVIPIDQY